MEPVTIVFNRVKICGANAVGGHGVVGYPSMTAFAGWMQEAARRVAGVPEGVHMIDFAVVHHTGRSRMYGKYRDKMTQKRYLHSDAGSPSKEQHWQSPPEDIRPQMDLTVTMVLRANVTPERMAWLRENENVLPEFAGHRALGGVAHEPKKASVRPGLVPIHELVRGGRVVVDVSDRLVDSERDPLDVMLDLISTKSEQHEWLFPSHTGYLAVSPVKERNTGRADSPHCHAEPIFGQCSFTSLHASEESNVFWAPKSDIENGILS